MTTFSKRRAIINLLVTNLLEIDEAISPFDSSYTFKTNMFNNVYRGAKNLENINDFPVMFLFAGPEFYNYQTIGNTEGILTVMIRAFIKTGNSIDLRTLEGNLVDDIDHVIYKMPTTSHNIETIDILSVDSSQGLLDDYGIIEIKIKVRYELDNI